MISKDNKSQQTLKSIARLKQIEDALLQSERNEHKAYEALEKSGKAQDAVPLDLEVRFLTERLEFYNEKVQIQSDLLHSCAELPTETNKDQIVALAKQLDLAKTLRNERLERVGAKSCWTNCTDCITSCTECVTDCGLSGENFGSSCIGGTLVSACRPNPGF